MVSGVENLKKNGTLLDFVLLRLSVCDRTLGKSVSAAAVTQ
jgi:hypothetical protein